MVIGGGIAGLAAAFRLHRECPDWPLTIVEEAGRLGGKIVTERVNGFVIEGGPDCFLAAKPAAVRLCRELGLEDRLQGTAPNGRRAYVMRRGKLHELPDGSQHVDWMLAQDSEGRDPLITFRVAGRIDELAVGRRLAAQRITDHRPLYLDYEGPVSGGRGLVRRLSRGFVRSLERAPDQWRLEVVWHLPESAPRSQGLRLDRVEGESWTITAIRVEPVTGRPPPPE